MGQLRGVSSEGHHGPVTIFIGPLGDLARGGGHGPQLPDPGSEMKILTIDTLVFLKVTRYPRYLHLMRGWRLSVIAIRARELADTFRSGSGVMWNHHAHRSPGKSHLSGG